ncbi:Vitamin B12 ABC transporter, B12-binding component BtuF [Thermodesulfovibrio sp. N1]|uniref:ABC transporter substrate-binding protein n=1 Tax=Thermodesulfovibrio sp. N1 TaxID=1871110 RepID=UPI00083A5B38|nr:helical backbone metal receptor [Thermodesulfovibrio sp. N1]ODA43874.1 Vitamin B12 ABC transporter, B12-binding component BtuF [Thermodesulfovibrio sp. N1]
MVVLRVFLIILIFFSSAFADPQRIVSLAPNVTETLYYLEANDKLIGVTNYCNWPEEVKNKPKIGGMINPSFEKILSLKPDLVIISRDGTPKEVYKRLIDLGLNVYVFAPKNLKELPQEIIKLGNIIGRTKKAKEVAQNFQREINKIKKVFHGEKALFIIWHEPIIVAGESSHIDEIMKILGLNNIAKFSSMNVEEIIKKNPEVIFLGTGHEVTVKHLLFQLKDTTALKKGNIFYVSDKVYRLSPRIIEGIKEMVDIKIKK